MSLKIHGHTQSTSTQRVLLVLKEKKIPYELVSIDWAVQEHKQPDWLQFHPFAQMPYIEDNGFILYESRAIAHYLVAAYPEEGPALVPAPDAGVRAHALFQQALSVEAFQFDPTVAGIMMEQMYKPHINLTPDDDQVSTLTATLETKLEGYERILSKTKYLAGDELTLADLFHAPFLSLFGPAKITLLTDYEKAKKWPHVVRWASDLMARNVSESD